MAYYKCGSIHPTQNSNVVVDTASGAVANFQTPLAMPLLKTRFDFKATQDLHGQSGPYPAGGSAQKWDEETVNGYLSSTDGSFMSNDTSICSKNFNPVLQGTDYYPYKGSSVPASYIYWYDNNKDFISRDLMASMVVTAPNNAAYFKISSYGYGTTYKNDISLNYPSTDTAYHPYSNICPIDGVSEINVKKCGKNLFDLNSLSASGITIENGVVSGIAQKYSDNFGLNTNGLKGLKYKENTKYTISCKAYTDGSYTTSGTGLYFKISYTDGSYSSLSIPNNQQELGFFEKTSNANKTIDKIQLAYSSGYSNIWYLKEIQIEENTSATAYEPYNGSTILINLGGTYYGGYVSQDKDGKREITVTKGITTLGDLTNWRYAQGSGVWRFQAKMPNDYKLPETISERLDFISSCFKPDLSPTTGGSVDNSIAGYTNDTKVYILCNKYTDLETFLTDLSSQTLVYTLAEPFTVALPDGQPIKSLPGVNNIFADTGNTSLQFRKIG